jgi:hypothetical protein
MTHVDHFAKNGEFLANSAPAVRRDKSTEHSTTFQVEPNNALFKLPSHLNKFPISSRPVQSALKCLSRRFGLL